jgi:hypothetical protein
MYTLHKQITTFGFRIISGISLTNYKPINFSYIMSHHAQNHASSGAVYGFGLIGAAVWFISQATSFWAGALGFLKALVWPAFLVYEAFKHLAGLE